MNQGWLRVSGHSCPPADGRAPETGGFGAREASKRTHSDRSGAATDADGEVAGPGRRRERAEGGPLCAWPLCVLAQPWLRDSLTSDSGTRRRLRLGVQPSPRPLAGGCPSGMTLHREPLSSEASASIDCRALTGTIVSSRLPGLCHPKCSVFFQRITYGYRILSEEL